MTDTPIKTEAVDTPTPAESAENAKVRVATVWLDGCSGCHMSLLDMDERIIAIAEQIEVVYGPLVDIKEYPEDVDVALVEGAISSDEDQEKIMKVRERTKILVVLGDCGITSNVPGMRNQIPPDRMLHAIYGDVAPHGQVPELLTRSRPIHEFVDVDVYVPGCPPSADLIHSTIADLLAGRVPAARARFG